MRFTAECKSRRRRWTCNKLSVTQQRYGFIFTCRLPGTATTHCMLHVAAVGAHLSSRYAKGTRRKNELQNHPYPYGMRSNTLTLLRATSQCKFTTLQTQLITDLHVESKSNNEHQCERIEHKWKTAK